MKKLLLTFLLLPMILLGQKNNNGKVYDKHPAINIVEQFTEAWISGDAVTLKNLTGEGFKMGSSMNNNPNYKGGDIGNLIGQSTWMSSNFVNISLKNRGQAYSDAIESKRSGLIVQHFKNLLPGIKTMHLSSKLHLMQPLFSIKMEKKLFVFGGQIIKLLGKNGIYQDRQLKMEPYTKTTHT